MKPAVHRNERSRTINVITISFKTTPDHYTILLALANAEKLTLSEFIRHTLAEALDLDRHSHTLTQLIAAGAQAQPEP